jgi:hypothetical protein
LILVGEFGWGGAGLTLVVVGSVVSWCWKRRTFERDFVVVVDNNMFL